MKINGYLTGNQLRIVHAALATAGYDSEQAHPGCYAKFCYMAFVNALHNLEQPAVAAPSPQDGRSQRDYFIAHAPASEIDNLMPSTVGELATWLGLTDEYDFSRDYVRCVAKARGIWADAMLAAAKESP